MSLKYETAEQWRNAAMERENSVDAEESMRRRAMVEVHHRSEGTVPDEDKMADYELYILGKMHAEEYQQYLLFKHGAQ